MNARDIDALFTAIGAGSNEPRYDVSGDGAVNFGDVTHVVESILETHLGNANLDGRVDRSDLAIVADYFGRRDDPGWQHGDFNGDGRVSLRDLVLLQANFQDAAAPAAAAQSRAAETFPTANQSQAPLRASRVRSAPRIGGLSRPVAIADGASAHPSQPMRRGTRVATATRGAPAALEVASVDGRLPGVGGTRV